MTILLEQKSRPRSATRAPVQLRSVELPPYPATCLALRNLRGLFILILISFHGCLAYLGSTTGPASSFDQPPFQWVAFPIVDSQRWWGFDFYCAWEDVHVMALMFFLSGVFVAPSSRAKAAGASPKSGRFGSGRHFSSASSS